MIQLLISSDMLQGTQLEKVMNMLVQEKLATQAYACTRNVVYTLRSLDAFVSAYTITRLQETEGE